jgi:hypothetical protein
MGKPGDDHRHARAAASVLALLIVLLAGARQAHADWRFLAAELQGGAIFWDENPGMTSMNFLRFEWGTRRIMVGTEAFGFRFQMEKQVENRVVTDSVGIWETLPLTATYVLYEWQEDYGLTRGYRYLCLYGRVNALLARTFNPGRQVRYGEGGVSVYWHGPHHAPVVSLALRAGYRLQHLGEYDQEDVTQDSELEHQLLFGVTVSLDFWSSSYFKRDLFLKQTVKREREWQHYEP